MFLTADRSSRRLASTERLMHGFAGHSLAAVVKLGTVVIISTSRELATKEEAAAPLRLD